VKENGERTRPVGGKPVRGRPAESRRVAVMVSGGESCLGVLIATIILCILTRVPWERITSAVLSFLWPEERKGGDDSDPG